jgi:hypothetical protein
MAAKKYLTLGANGARELRSATDSSAGAANAGDIAALDAEGKLNENMMPDGVGEDIVPVPASEALASNDLVNLWDDDGTVKARKADATAAGKEVDGFVKDAVDSAATADVYLSGTISGLSDLAPGANYLMSTTPGGITATAPSTVGNVVQRIGKAKSATAIVFRREAPTTIVS